jgi:hypothetical protein
VRPCRLDERKHSHPDRRECILPEAIGQNGMSDLKRVTREPLGTEQGRGLIRRLLVTRAAGKHGAGLLQAGGVVIPCMLGRNGVSRSKREGDGKTPAGAFRLIGGYKRKDRLLAAHCALQLRPIGANMGWCDDPADANYNRPLRLPARARHEELLRDDGLYDVVLVLDHNQRPRARGHGSAIFFHLTRNGNDPTAGCVAISRAAMLRLLPRLARNCVMIIR